MSPTMPHDQKKNSAFCKVQPLCVKLTKNSTIEDIDKLETALKELDEDEIVLLQEYVLFPFRLLLCRKVNEKLTIRCIDFIKFLFNRTSVKSWPLFSNIFTQLFGMISVFEDISKVSDASEELKFCICQCIVSLVYGSTEEVMNEMYSASFRLPLAQSFFVLTRLLMHEKSKSLRQEVLKAIGILTYSPEFTKFRCDKTEELASEALASYFPGLSITLQSVACGDPKQGHSVVTLSLNILSNLIVLVLNDHCYENCDKCTNMKSVSETESKVPVIIKNSEWFKEVSSKMKILIQNISLLASHAHWKVRVEFLKFTSCILYRCMKSLENCISELLPAIFALSVDNYEIVASHGRNLINSFSEQFQTLNTESLKSIIEDDIYASTSKLIKYKLSANDVEKLSLLKTLQGYIEILGSSLNHLLLSVSHLERIIFSLVNLLEFDTSMINMVEEVSVPKSFDITAPNLWPRKKFNYFEDEEILNTVCKICYILGCRGNARLLVDYLIDNLHSSNLYTLQYIFLIGNIISGFSNELSSDVDTELIGDVIEELLSPAIWELQVCDTSDQQPKEHVIDPCMDLVLTSKVYNSNVYQICLILETIAKCAKTLKYNFRVHLIKTLCTIMEKAGSSNFMISQSGRVCLYSIAQSCGYNSVTELIKDNADYIINSVTIHFHHFLHKPEVAVVLRVAIEESDSEAITLFRDAVYQTLRILDLNQDKAYPLMTILFTVVTAVKKWYPSTKSEITNTESLEKANDLKTHLFEYKASKKIENELDFASCYDEEGNIQIPESDPEQMDDSIAVDEEKKIIPLHVNITEKILKRCIHLQSSRDLYLRILALETAETCILAIRDFENQLHPLVHELWSPFVQRFSEDVIVVLRAFKVLLVIADECRDFVRVRTLKDVVPKLIDFLKKEYSASLLKSNFRNYKWTNAHKLQVCVLSEIGNLYTKLDVGEKDVAVLAEVCLPYLKKEQPKVLQEAAAKSVKDLAAIDANAMWLYYNEMFCKEKTLIPPHESLAILSFPYSNSSDTTITIEF